MISRLFWVIFLLGAYVWVVSSGNEKALLEKGRAVYEAIANWLDSADMDFQLKEKKHSKRSRRWD